MLYKVFLKTRRKCPFCDYQQELIEKKSAYLTYALAPYSKNHLLVVPRRHVVSFRNLNRQEEKDISDLLEQGAEIFHKLKIKDYTILVRNGTKQKSIPHLHYHLIPNHRIGDIDSKERRRRLLSDKEITQLTTKLGKIIKS